MAKVYVQEVSEKNQPNGYAGLDSSGKVPTSLIPDIAAGGNARVLLWDVASGDYLPAAYRTDTSNPREFVGPVDPSTLSSIVGPVFGDRWTPTAEPT